MDIETGKRIRSIRVQKGWSQDELGKKLDLDQGTISRMERGETDPTAKTLRLLKEIFVVTIDWILTGQGPKHPLPLEAKEEIIEILDDFTGNQAFMLDIISYAYDYKARHLKEFLKKETGKNKNVKAG